MRPLGTSLSGGQARQSVVPRAPLVAPGTRANVPGLRAGYGPLGRHFSGVHAYTSSARSRLVRVPRSSEWRILDRAPRARGTRVTGGVAPSFGWTFGPPSCNAPDGDYGDRVGAFGRAALRSSRQLGAFPSVRSERSKITCCRSPKRRQRVHAGTGPPARGAALGEPIGRTCGRPVGGGRSAARPPPKTPPLASGKRRCRLGRHRSAVQRRTLAGGARKLSAVRSRMAREN
jgi:hypothetical protein